MLAPSVNPALTLRSRPTVDEPISSVAFVSPTGMWSAAVLQRVSSAAMRRTGRTAVIDQQDAAQRALIEYIDVEMPEIAPLRAVSLAVEPGSFSPIAPFMERLSLLVFMLASSDAEGFTAYVRAWLALPQVITSAPRVLVLAGMAPERVDGMLQTLRAGTTLTVNFISVKLSDSAAVWRAAQKALRDQTATARAPAASVREAPSADAGTDAKLVAESGCPQELLELDGAIAAVLIDAERCATLLTLDQTGATSRSFADDAELPRGKRRPAMALRIDDPIEDIAVTTQDGSSIYRALARRPELFVGLIFDHDRVPLAMARLRLQEIVEALALLPI